MPRDRHRPRRRSAWGRDLPRLVAFAVTAALVVTVAVGAVAYVGTASAGYHRTLSRGFTTLAAPLAARSDGTGVALAYTLAGMWSTTRPALFSALDSNAAAAAREHRDVQAAASPPAPGGASVGCVDALAMRAEGTIDVQQGIEGILGGRTGTSATAGDQPTAVRLLEHAGALFVRSDASWERCRHAVSGINGGPRLPRSTWVSDPTGWLPQTLVGVVAALVQVDALRAAPRLVIGPIATSPALVLTGGAPGVVPSTSTLVLHVVVADQGNVDEHGVRVTARALPVSSSSGSAGASSAPVDVVAGSSVAVSLPPIAVAPGVTYTVDVTAGDTAGGAPASALITLAVATPPPTTTVPPATTTAPASRHVSSTSRPGG
jgi:hypothetical protein